MKVFRRTCEIKALSFDLDDTLYDNHPVIRKVEQEMAKWLNTEHPVSAHKSLEEWQQVKRDVVRQNPDLRHDVTLWRKEQIVWGLMQLGYDEPKAQKAAEEGIRHALWLRNQVDVPEESHQILQSLAAKYPLIAITNGNVDVHKIGLGDYFVNVLKAGPDGRSKPYPDMFITASSLLNLPASQILHVGDHLLTDVMGAKQCGFSACWINTSGETLRTSSKSKVLPDIEIEAISELECLL